MTRPWSQLFDAVMVLVLLTVILSVLDPSFASHQYLLVGTAPAVGLLALAGLLMGRPQGVWIFWVVAMLVYAPLGAVIAMKNPGELLVPSLESMGGLLGASFTSPVDLARTLPPVGDAGTMLVVPYAIGYVSGAGAGWLALGTRAPSLPLLPLGLGLAGAVYVGTLVPDHMVLRGSVLAGLMLWWVAVRARRGEPTIGRHRGVVAQGGIAAALIVVVSGATVALVPDDVEVDRVLLRTQSGAEPLPSNVTSPFDVVAGAHDRTLLLVRGLPGAQRLRFGTLDWYDGRAWMPGDVSSGTGEPRGFQRINSEVAPLEDGDEIRVRVRVRPAYRSDWLPLAGDLTSLELDYRDGRTQLSQVRYNQATGSALVIGGVDPRDRYTFTAVVGPAGTVRRVRPDRPTAEQRQPRAAGLDHLLRRWIDMRRQPMGKLTAFMSHLRRHGGVLLRGETDQTLTGLGRDFLGAPIIAGTAHQYTTLVALAASRLGVPARVVVGAVPDDQGRVRPQDVSSWVELRSWEGRWRPLDPRTYMGTRNLAGGGDSGRSGWTPPAGGHDRQGGGKLRLPKGTEVELPPGTRLPKTGSPWSVVGLTAVGTALAMVLVLALMPLVKLVRRSRRRRARSWSQIYVGGWQEVVDTARDLGVPVPDRLGRVPQARRLGLGSDLARTADAAVFASEPPVAADRRQYWSQTQALRRSILADLPWHRRVRAWLNPASLITSWARAGESRELVNPGPRPGSRSRA